MTEAGYRKPSWDLTMPGAWAEHAACRHADPELFFPEKAATAVPAKRICATCPVIEPCLEFALENQEVWGVWGGASERERAAMRRWRRAS